MNTRFLQPLKIYTVVGILLGLNDALVIILGISLNKNTWHVNGFDYFQNDTFMFYHVHIFFTIWSIVYTFGGNIYKAKFAKLIIYLIFFQTGLMDIVIAFEWIEILFPRVNILRRFSILKISFVAFVFSVLVNFPVNIVRAVEKQQFKMDSNETITLSAYGKSLLAANLPNRILYIVFKI